MAHQLNPRLEQRLEQPDRSELVRRFFERLQQPLPYRSFGLGVGEYLAAQDLLQNDRWSGTLSNLKTALRLLWCHSLEERASFDGLWTETLETFKDYQEPPPDRSDDSTPEPREPLNEPDPPDFNPPVDEQSLPAEPPPDRPLPLEPLPVRAPLHFTRRDHLNLPDLNRYTPLSRRAMSYHWRYLRMPMATGIQDVLDLEATVAQVAEQGFFLAPVYRRRLQNGAKLVLFLDQQGSMVPFHRLTRDLVETLTIGGALQESHITIVYFQNIPHAEVYTDPYLTQPQALESVLDNLDSETSIIVVSDAGAARGHRSLPRIQSTSLFLRHLYHKTSRIIWLNPMPHDRWRGSSAEMIADRTSMYALDADSFSQAIDTLRHSHSVTGSH